MHKTCCIYIFRMFSAFLTMWYEARGASHGIRTRRGPAGFDSDQSVLAGTRPHLSDRLGGQLDDFFTAHRFDRLPGVGHFAPLEATDRFAGPGLGDNSGRWGLAYSEAASDGRLTLEKHSERVGAHGRGAAVGRVGDADERPGTRTALPRSVCLTPAAWAAGVRHPSSLIRRLDQSAQCARCRSCQRLPRIQVRPGISRWAAPTRR
jgi:hypothetical protein